MLTLRFNPGEDDFSLEENTALPKIGWKLFLEEHSCFLHLCFHEIFLQFWAPSVTKNCWYIIKTKVETMWKFSSGHLCTSDSLIIWIFRVKKGWIFRAFRSAKVGLKIFKWSRLKANRLLGFCFSFHYLFIIKFLHKMHEFNIDKYVICK